MEWFAEHFPLNKEQPTAEEVEERILFQQWWSVFGSLMKGFLHRQSMEI